MKNERIDIRVSKEDKEIIEKAASLSSLSLSSYVISTVLKQARYDITGNKEIILSKKEGQKFIEIMDESPEANTRLKELLKDIDFNKEIEKILTNHIK